MEDQDTIYQSSQEESFDTPDTQMPDESTHAMRNGSRRNGKRFGLGAAAGVGVGAGAAALSGSSLTPDDQESATDQEELSTDQPVEETSSSAAECPVASSVDDSMSFNEAFDHARSEVGPGGVFEWHGRLYNTYLKDEWDEMTEAERADYYDKVALVDHPTTTDSDVVVHHYHHYVSDSLAWDSSAVQVNQVYPAGENLASNDISQMNPQDWQSATPVSSAPQQEVQTDQGVWVDSEIEVLGVENPDGDDLQPATLPLSNSDDAVVVDLDEPSSMDAPQEILDYEQPSFESSDFDAEVSIDNDDPVQQSGLVDSYYTE